MAITRLTKLILDLAGGHVAGKGQAQLPSRTLQGFKKVEIRFAPDFIPKFLGIADLTAQKVKSVLQALDCEVEEGGEWTVVAPTYRRDLRIPEDLAEEVARTVGYDQIPATIPALSSDPRFGASHRDRLTLIQRTKDSLVASGLSETINFCFHAASLGCRNSGCPQRSSY